MSRCPPEEAAIAAVFLSGRAFPVREEATLQVGGALLWRAVEELSGKTAAQLGDAYKQLGDLGAVAGATLPDRGQPGLSLAEVQQTFRALAGARGSSTRATMLHHMLGRASPLEAKYLVKIMTGDLRIGFKESLVEEAIARAYGADLREVQRSNMLLGDIGECLLLASRGTLRDARMRLFHPLGFMLASPVASAEEAMAGFPNPRIEDKYDGIRAQVHVSPEEVRIFSRTRDDITESFPDLSAALDSDLPDGVILDGEIVAWSHTAEGPGRALPFSALQQRLGRRKVSADMMRRVPVAYLAFDVLYADGLLLLDHKLEERSAILDRIFAGGRNGPRPEPGRAPRGRIGQQGALFSEDETRGQVLRAPVFQAATAGELESLFEQAQARGNEGLMIKAPDSPYAAGRRGQWWLKLKRELATLDVVVTAVEYGHGKRIGVLSDYTFAVRDGDRLLNIGKAYSGLTDAEIAEMTRWFLDHTIAEEGLRRLVEPTIVIEVAFNNMMESDRHESGLALRFPRILRIRGDKPASEADTIETARKIYRSQHKA